MVTIDNISDNFYYMIVNSRHPSISILLLYRLLGLIAQYASPHSTIRSPGTSTMYQD
jgi:hypothetical protein